MDDYIGYIVPPEPAKSPSFFPYPVTVNFRIYENIDMEVNIHPLELRGICIKTYVKSGGIDLT